MKTEWISVEDRLPKPQKENVLLFDEELDQIEIGIFLYKTESITAFGIWAAGKHLQ